MLAITFSYHCDKQKLSDAYCGYHCDRKNSLALEHALAYALSPYQRAGRCLGNASNRGHGEKRYWWQRPCNTAQEGGEASALGSNGWRGSDTALGVSLKATWLRLGSLLRFGINKDMEHETIK